MAERSSKAGTFQRSFTYGEVCTDPRFQLAFVAFLAIVLIFSKLGGTGLANYDDCYYAQKAKEILQTGSWLTLHHGGVPKLDNPPFYMWLVALSYKVFGVTEYAAKFPSALAGVTTVVLVYFMARTLFNPWVGFLSSFVLSTTVIFTRYARHAMVDATLSFFVCLALFAFVLALRKHSRYFLLWGVCIGVCILTKSILGLFPLTISLLFLLATKRWRILWNGYFLLGGLIAVVLGFSWHLHQYATFGQEFLDVHFGWLILERGFQLEPQPWYRHLSYLGAIATQYWPWLPFLILGTVRFSKNAWRREESALLLLLWLGTILLTMSLLMTRVLWYVLPIFPAAAIISGSALDAVLPKQKREQFAKACVAFGILAAIVINASPLPLSSQRETDVRALSPYVKTLADRGAKVTAFRQTYHDLNNALLFYSDHAASPIFQDYAQLSQAFADSALVLCILSSSDLDAVLRNVPEIFVVRKTDKLALVSNRPLDVSSVQIW